ncbi:MAG: hypothetical protein V4471_00290 [Pseudomonadota bacterium]
MHEKNLENAGHFNHFIQAGLFSSIFTFTSNIGGIRTILESSLHAILFPIAIAPDLIASLLALFSLINTKNKNLGKLFDLIYAPAKTALVFAAVFAGFSLLTVHSLFLAAVGSGLAYHIGLCAYNAFYLFKTPKGSPANLTLRTLYKNNIIKVAISSLIGSVVITGILTTMVFAPYLAASALTIAGIGTAVTLLISSTYALYNHLKQPVPIQTNQTDNLTSLYNDRLKQGHTATSKAYYDRKFRSKQLTGDLQKDKIFLLGEIQDKQEELNAKIYQSKEKKSEVLWPENPKRAIKYNFLRDLEMKLHRICPENDLIPDCYPNSLNDRTSILHPPKKAFQSFFRAVGDVEDIAEAVNDYAENYKKQVVTNPSELVF